MSDVIVHTSTYQYVLIFTSMYMDEHSISQTQNYSVLYHFGLLDVMYCAWKMCVLILKHHETVLLYAQISMSDVTVHTSIYWYIPVCTDIY